MPGHEAGSNHHHVKHGLASFFLGLALLAFAWFQAGLDALNPPTECHSLQSSSPTGRRSILGFLAGRRRAVPDLEPRAQRDPAEHPRLEHPPERPVLHHVPRRDPSRRRALVLLGFFWDDGVRIVKGLGRSLRDRGIDPADTDAKLAWLIVVGTIPAGILGLRSSASYATSSRRPARQPFFLTLNGLLLFGAEVLRRRSKQVEQDDDARIARQLGWGNAVGIGSAQALALIPGFSRSGMAMGGGLLAGLSNLRRGTLLVPARDADHRSCRHSTSCRSSSARPATASVGRRWSPLSVRRSLRTSSVSLPDALLRDEHADSVRDLLRRRRHRGFALLHQLATSS